MENSDSRGVEAMFAEIKGEYVRYDSSGITTCYEVSIGVMMQLLFEDYSVVETLYRTF